MSLLYSEKFINFGLLVLRLGLGIIFILHGYPILFEGGSAKLAMYLEGAKIPFPSVGAWLAGIAEFGGGIALILGLFSRPAALVLTINMAVAVLFHLNLGHKFLGQPGYSHALESAIVFFVLTFTGPGAYSIDAGMFSKK